jgi:hypothetical protein
MKFVKAATAATVLTAAAVGVGLGYPGAGPGA